MEINIKNVGKIKTCNIELNGITVVAGENSSGKSTIGKTLYSIYHTFYNVAGKVQDQKKRAVNRVLWAAIQYLFLKDEELEEIITKCSGKEIDEIVVFLREFLPREENEKGVDYQDIAVNISEALSLSEEEVMKLVFKRNIISELGGNIGNVNYPEEETAISIQIKNEKVIDIQIGEKIACFEYTNINKDIIYIDDPYVVDALQNSRAVRGMVDDHKKDLFKKLIRNDNDDLIGEYITTQKLNDIYGMLSQVCDGNLVNEQGKWLYHSSHLKKNLDLNSVSAGLKNFVVLRTLLEKGSITRNGIIVMDEPEINLHPKWQLVLAELLVILQKEFQINILLNTHSPFFLNAIEAYSKKYAVSDACKYYLTSNNGEWAEIQDVTGRIDAIYKVLAAPLQTLEMISNE